MKKEANALCISLLLLSTLAFQNLTITRSITEEEEIEYYVKSTVTYSNKGSKVWNFTERKEDRTIGLFMNNDTDGNQIAILQFPEMLLNPRRNISFGVTYRVVTKPRALDHINETASKSLNEIPVSLREKYLAAEGPWLVNDTELQNLAFNIAGDESNVLAIIKNFVSWINRNIDYPLQMHEVPQYPNETMTKNEGDCDDQAILLVTLCRIIRIPAFIQIGAIYIPSRLENISYWKNQVTAVQKQIGWHGWAVVYVPPWGWLPVDLTYVFEPITADPLNAIKNAAVTSQITVQYKNISHTNYVASSREAREFLTTNNLYVYMEDEMIEVIRKENSSGENVERLFPVVLVVAVAALLACSYVIARKLNKKEEIHTPPC